MSSSTVLRPGGRGTPKPRRGSVYKGAEGMWSWVAHRITGVLTFFFLFAHVLDTALVRVSPDSYNKVIATYKNPLVNLLEVEGLDKFEKSWTELLATVTGELERVAALGGQS